MFVYQLLLVFVVRLQRQQVVLGPGEQHQVVLPPPPEERQVLLPSVCFEVGQHFVVMPVVVGLAHLLQLELPEAVFPAHQRQIAPSVVDFDAQARYRLVRPFLATQHALRQTPDVLRGVCLVRVAVTDC